MIYRLIYTSTAAPEKGESDFRAIATFAAMNNAAHDIVGLLIVYGHDIMQVLEGPKEAVLRLMQNIKADERHYDVKVVFESPIERRSFEKWSMRYHVAGKRSDMDVFFDLARSDLPQSRVSGQI